MNLVKYIERHFDFEKEELHDVAEWYVAAYPAKNILGIQKNGKKKFVLVEDSGDYAFKLMKAKIKSADGVTGLFRFIETSIENDCMCSLVEKVLNFAFDEMKEAKV